jgi:hypothetical protein
MSKEQFRNSLRAAVRGLWLGALSSYEFPDAFGAALDKYLKQAFDTGMARYDISPEDYTDEDIEAFQQLLNRQYESLPGFRDWIVSNSKPFEGKLDTVLARVEIWANRYDEAMDLGRMRAGGDERLLWKINPVKEHCETCRALDGWVKRASYWEQLRIEWQIYPKSEKLQCHGYRCGCTLQPTRRPLSKGKPPIRL